MNFPLSAICCQTCYIDKSWGLSVLCDCQQLLMLHAAFAVQKCLLQQLGPYTKVCSQDFLTIQVETMMFAFLVRMLGYMHICSSGLAELSITSDCCW